MRDADNIRAIEQTGVDWMGFIFYPRSPRYVATLPDYLPTQQKRIGVFVNVPTSEIIATAKRFGLFAAQLHGNETPQQLHEVKTAGLTTIKALGIRDKRDIDAAYMFEEADYLLFDTQAMVYGGSGKRFDWDILQYYNGKTPFILSGGISETVVDDILSFKHPYLAGVDLNSGFETSPGIKNAESVSRFVSAIRNSCET